MAAAVYIIIHSIVISSAASVSMDNEISAVPKMKKKWNSKSERELQFETTDSSADDEIIDSHNELVLHKKGVNVTASTFILPSSTDTNSNNELICAPVEDCELCPHKWKQSLEMVEEKIKGELESCVKYGRRQRFECTVLFQGESFVFIYFYLKQNGTIVKLHFCHK